MNWITAPLAKVSKVFDDGDWIESKDQSEDGIRLVQTGNVGEGVFKDRRDKARFISEATFKRLNCSEVQPGDILISRLPDPVGRACVVPDTGDKMITAVDCTIVRPDDDRIDPSFLIYYSQTANYLRDIEQRCTGTTRKRISRKSLGQISIPLPPLEEQKRIVAVLDQAFAALDRARALAEANLADAEELFERQLAREFADAVDPKETAPFGQLCTALTPKTKIQRKEYLEDGAFPIVSQEADLVSGYWNDQSALMGLTKPVVVFGDHTRCLKYIDFDFVVGADGTKVLLPKSGIDPLYLYYGLRSVPLAEKGYARHFKFLKEASLPKLELSEQGRVSLGLRSLEEEVIKLTAAYYGKLGELTDLRQSFLQKAFAGELT